MENEKVTFTVTDVELAAAAMKILDGPEYKDDFTLRGICVTFFSRLRNDLEARYEFEYPEECWVHPSLT
jgi:hypothetical protein